MATLTENPSTDDILKERLTVYEEEINKLNQNIKQLQGDLTETRNSLAKITKEFQDQEKLFQKEKNASKSFKEEHTKVQDDYKQISNTLSQMKIEDEKKRQKIVYLQQQFDNKVKQGENQTQLSIEEISNKDAKIKNIQTLHAKEIGKLKNELGKELEERVNRFAKRENALKNELMNLNNTITTQDRDFKDTIASQATRLVAYEHQINVMEKQMTRLKLQAEYNRIPKVDNDDELVRLKNENVSLKSKCQENSTQISELISRLGLVRINQHHDFRSNATF